MQQVRRRDETTSAPKVHRAVWWRRI